MWQQKHMLEAEIGVIQLQAKECQIYQQKKVVRGKEWFPYRFQKEHGLFTSSLQNCEIINLLFLATHFVTATLRNYQKAKYHSN